MPNNSSSNNSNTSTNTTNAPTATQLPGVNNTQVITSTPNMIKENSQNSSTTKK
jgi:hypothetical protein